jgi:hypothetical protein
MKKLIDAGYGSRLTLDWWSGEGGEINLLVPSIVGNEGQRARWWEVGQCTFLTTDGKCEIHHLKPVEGRIANHKRTPKSLHKKVALT